MNSVDQHEKLSGNSMFFRIRSNITNSTPTRVHNANIKDLIDILLYA